MIGWLLIILSFIVLGVGGYLFPDAILVKLIGWGLFFAGIALASRYLEKLVAVRRKQADKYWEQHPANKENIEQLHEMK